MVSSSYVEPISSGASSEALITGEISLRSKPGKGIINAVNTAQMAFSDAYINGVVWPDEWVEKGLKSALHVLYTQFPSWLIPYDWVLEEADSLAEGSDYLMKVQYNLPVDLFRHMLGESSTMHPKYSMALWERGAMDLEQAQTHMLDDLIEKLDIQDGDEILDLGCGWGSAANYLLYRFPNVKVTGLNLSRSQCDYIRQKMKAPDSHLSDGRFTLKEGDFNTVTFDQKFDKIITIGFFEHVGNFTKSFKKMASFLKPEGKVFLHIIATRLPHNAYSPFMNQYIFPRMRIWHYNAASRCNQDLKTVQQWYFNGHNYGQTLRHWLQKFDAAQDQISTLDVGMDYSKFRRMWRLYLLWCIAYFETCDGDILGNGQYLMEPV